MIELKDAAFLIWKINFDDYNILDYPFTLSEKINLKNIFVAYDIENKLMKLHTHRVYKRFYDIKE